MLFLYVVNVRVAFQFQSLENRPFEESRISKPLFCTLPTFTFGGVAPPKISGKETGNNKPFDSFLYQSVVILNFPFHKTLSKPALITTSSCHPVLGSPT